MGIYNDSLSGSDQEYRTWRMTSRVHSRMDSRQTLCAHEWRPSRLAPIGCVYFAHGMGEHAFAYRHLGQQLAAAGFVVLAVDYYGHGLSDGSRLSVGFYDAVKDYLDFVSATALRRHDLPRFMLGQSLGGLLAMHVVLTDQSQWAGLVLSAAAIGVDWDVAKLAAYATFSTLARLGVKPDWKVLPAFSGAEICRVRSCGARFVINFASGGAGVWLQQRKKIACPASLAGFPARNRSSAWSPRCLVETFVGVSQRCGIPPILPVFLISGAGLSWPPIHRNER
mmetsp:Transcript_8344/g.15810  ORF Transcript_8344/g.15810 Transcript_8344/m.15810 type:complete len:281 (-) Transcript_8344:1561-2403(-)